MGDFFEKVLRYRIGENMREYGRVKHSVYLRESYLKRADAEAKQLAKITRFHEGCSDS